jgi:arginase
MNVKMIGVPYCLGASIEGTEIGPSKIESLYKTELENLGISFESLKVRSIQKLDKSKDIIPEYVQMCNDLAAKLNGGNSKPIVFGGDHSIAVGTWSGVINSLKAESNFGLIWVDAHTDAHTYQSSLSKNYHGMPLSFLLGEGDERLSNIGGTNPKLRPEHLVIIGARSFEDAEIAFLNSKGVRIYYMDEVIQRGFETCFNEAVERVHAGKRYYGVSLDFDYFDPNVAPGVGTPEANGGDLESVKSCLKGIINTKFFAALELVEYNTLKDIDNKTAKIAFELIKSVIS